MIDKIKEIVNSWVISKNPTEYQIRLAEERYKICSDCDKIEQNVLGFPQCSECGCFINKKIFSPKYDACPLHKWLDVENSNIFGDTQKKNNSLI